MGAAIVGAAILALAGAAPAGAQSDSPAADPAPAPPGAGPEADPAPNPQATSLKVRVKRSKGSRVKVGRRAKLRGKMSPWLPDQKVTVTLRRGGKTVMKREAKVTPSKRGGGQFKVKGPKLVKPGGYRATAEYSGSAELAKASARSRKAKIAYPSLKRGNRGRDVKLFNRLLARQGYVPSRGHKFTSRTGRAVLAFRKVNRMARISRANSKIFKRLADGRGTYKLKHPSAGRHVEVSISRQVMVLADKGKAKRIYHVSTGKSSTPTIRGHYRFYMRQPGFNNIGMYYSVYFRGGYAIHGYRSVPTYPASHGCVRTPNADARYIYNWVRLGMSIYTYS